MKQTLIAAALLCYGLAFGQSTPQGTTPTNCVPIIYDDDWGVDSDDEIATAVAFYLEDLGLIRIEAMTSCCDYRRFWFSPVLADCIAKYYGHPEILIGGPQTNWLHLTSAGSPDYALRFCTNTDEGLPAYGLRGFTITNYPHTVVSSTNGAISAVRAWRRVLASNPAKTVKIIMAGTSRNLYETLHSGPDSISPLTGAQLISNALEIVCISGDFPATTTDVSQRWEYDNFENDAGCSFPEAAFVYTNNLGCMVTYVGEMFHTNTPHVGFGLMSRPVSDICRSLLVVGQWGSAYYGALDSGTSVDSAPGAITQWGLLWAAYGSASLNGSNVFGVVGPGWITLGIPNDGSSRAWWITNGWVADVGGGQQYLIPLASQVWSSNYLDAIYRTPMKAPGKPKPVYEADLSLVTPGSYSYYMVADKSGPSPFAFKDTILLPATKTGNVTQPIPHGMGFQNLVSVVTLVSTNPSADYITNMVMQTIYRGDLVPNFSDLAHPGPGTRVVKVPDVDGGQPALYAWGTNAWMTKVTVTNSWMDEISSRSLTFSISTAPSNSWWVVGWHVRSLESNDTDGDGIPDSWTMRYFGHATGQAGDQSYASDDPAGDGLSNLQKYLLDRNPLIWDNQHFTACQYQSNGQFKVTLFGQVGHNYTLQASTNLVNWLPVCVFACTNGTMDVFDPEAKSFRSRFYRLAPPALVPGLRLGLRAVHPLTTNGLDLVLLSTPGLNYRIDASSDLINWAAITNFFTTNATINFRDTSATNFSRRFYRAVAP